MQVQTTQINRSKKVSEELNTLLASEYTLYTKLRNFHWNVVGPHFQEYHKFFEETYEEVETHIDDTAEKVRTLGFRPLSSMEEFLKHTFLKESTTQNMSAQEMLSELAQDYKAMITQLNAKIKVCQDEKDVGVEDFLTGILQEYEKKLWMIESMNS
ncbi:MAG: Dps family protein [Candidatus Nanoarchaeia archaeon]